MTFKKKVHEKQYCFDETMKDKYRRPKQLLISVHHAALENKKRTYKVELRAGRKQLRRVRKLRRDLMQELVLYEYR